MTAINHFNDTIVSFPHILVVISEPQYRNVALLGQQLWRLNVSNLYQQIHTSDLYVLREFNII